MHDIAIVLLSFCKPRFVNRASTPRPYIKILKPPLKLGRRDNTRFPILYFEIDTQIRIWRHYTFVRMKLVCAWCDRFIAGPKIGIEDDNYSVFLFCEGYCDELFE